MEFYCKIKVFPPLRCSLQLHKTPPSSPVVFALCFQPRPPWRAGSSHYRGREGGVQGGRLQHGPGPGVLLQDQEPQHQVTGVSQQKVQRYGRYWSNSSILINVIAMKSCRFVNSIFKLESYLYYWPVLQCSSVIYNIGQCPSVPVRNNEIIKRSSKSGTTATTSESNEEKCDDLSLSNETETAKTKMKHFATRRQASDSNLLKKGKYLEFARWEFSLDFPVWLPCLDPRRGHDRICLPARKTWRSRCPQ